MSAPRQPVVVDVENPTEAQLRAYGDMAFLAMRSGRHAAMRMGQFRDVAEPPVALGQFRIFRFDEVPRGMFTWALLSEAAQRVYVQGGVLRPEDWRSGPHLWIIDFLAPYRGMTSSMVRWIMRPGNMPGRRFQFRRVEGARETRRIVEIDLDRPRKARILGAGDFG